MRKKTIYEGIIVLGIGILLIAHYVGQCVNGLCAENWLIFNLVGGMAAVAIALYYILSFAKDGGLTVYRETKNIESVISYYKKIRLVGLFGFVYSVFMWFKSSINLDGEYKGGFVTFAIILIASVIIVVVLSSHINRITNRR
jgi:hypothetical protein